MEKKLFYTITKTLPQHEEQTGQLNIHVKSREKDNPEQIIFTWNTHYKYASWYGCQSRLGQGAQNLPALFPLLRLLHKIDEAMLTSGSGVQEVIALLESYSIEHAVLAQISNTNAEEFKSYITEKDVREGKIEVDEKCFEFTLEQLIKLSTQLIEEKYIKIP